MLSNQTDAELFQQLRSGNITTLGVFYERYGEVVYRVALRMLGNTQEAEDLTQEIFLYLSKKGNYDESRGSMLVFLVTMTRSRAIDKHRQKSSYRQRILKWFNNSPAQEYGGLMDKVALKEVSHKVRNAIARLPMQHQRVLEMAYFDGLTVLKQKSKVN
ncbi:MAG: sigma-70 family RNA polymerase sigma factor [Cyanobacterium sp.]